MLTIIVLTVSPPIMPRKRQCDANGFQRIYV